MSEVSSSSLAVCCPGDTLAQVEEFVHREPLKALATAFGVGLLLEVIPQRSTARAVAAVAVKLVSPTLLALGALKVWELYCDRSGTRKPRRKISAA